MKTISKWDGLEIETTEIMEQPANNNEISFFALLMIIGIVVMIGSFLYFTASILLSLSPLAIGLILVLTLL